MPAQGDFDRRCEPAEPELAVVVRSGHDERGLGQIHLGRDGPHPRLAGRGVEQADRGRVAPERFVGERVDPEQRYGHPDIRAPGTGVPARITR